MTEPDGKPQRRRRRAHRQGGAVSPASAAEPRPRQVSAGDLPAAGSSSGALPGPHQHGESTKGRRDGDTAKDRRDGDTAKGRRDGEQARGPGRDSERGWRELAGSSPSQVGLSGALRARDVARPSAQDLAAAERSVTVVRRHWQPPPA